MSDFTEWLQGELDKRGWKQSDLARNSGILPTYITGLLAGYRLPSPRFCGPIAHALDLPEEEVFRKAGLLSPLSFDSSKFTEWISLFPQLSEDNQHEMIELARIKLKRMKQ